MKKQKNRTYRILKTGNFFFPLRDIRKKFIVFNTYSLDLKEKGIGKEYKDIVKMNLKFNHINFKEYGDLFWRAIKEHKLDKEFKNCWLVPVHITYFNDNWIELDVDILKPVK